MNFNPIGLDLGGVLGFSCNLVLELSKKKSLKKMYFEYNSSGLEDCKNCGKFI